MSDPHPSAVPWPRLSSADAAALLVAHAAAATPADLPRALRAHVGGRRGERLARGIERGGPLGSALLRVGRASAPEAALLDEAAHAGLLAPALDRLRERATSVARMRRRLRWAVLGPVLVAMVVLGARLGAEWLTARRYLHGAEWSNHFADMGVARSPAPAWTPLALVWVPLVAMAASGAAVAFRRAGAPGRAGSAATVSSQIADWVRHTARGLPHQLDLDPRSHPHGTDGVARAIAADPAAADRHARAIEREIADDTAQVRVRTTLLVTLLVAFSIVTGNGTLAVIGQFSDIIRLVEMLG